MPRVRVYCSDQTHSSIDKAVILLGLGQESLRKIPCDPEFRMRPDALAARAKITDATIPRILRARLAGMFMKRK